MDQDGGEFPARNSYLLKFGLKEGLNGFKLLGSWKLAFVKYELLLLACAIQILRYQKSSPNIPGSSAGFSPGLFGYHFFVPGLGFLQLP